MEAGDPVEEPSEQATAAKAKADDQIARQVAYLLLIRLQNRAERSSSQIVVASLTELAPRSPADPGLLPSGQARS